MYQLTPNATLAVDLVITRWNSAKGAVEYLFVRRKYEPYKGRLALPGGLVEEMEATAEAAARELCEEAGLSILPPMLAMLGVWSNPLRDPRGRVVSVAYACQVAEHIGARAVAGDDAADVAWLTLAEVDRTQLAFDHDEILEAAVKARFRCEQWSKEERGHLEAQRKAAGSPPLEINKLPPLDPLVTRDDTRVPVWALLLQDLRAKGWAVAVHNDYRQDGQPKTFWLFAHPCGHWIKGEGANDYEALLVAQDAAARLPMPTPYGPNAAEAVFGFASWLSTRKEAVTFSEVHDAGRPAELAGTYCDAQGFTEPRLGIYPNNLKRMSENQ